MAKEILINQLFAGKYLNKGENIGHEVINLFKDDEGYHNLFITPYGTVRSSNLEYILFVRNVSDKRIVEVVGVAKGIEPISIEETQKVRYGGVSLDEIFCGNTTLNDEDDTFTNHITLRARQFLVPTKPIFITLDDLRGDDVYIRLRSERKVVISQSMKGYYSAESDRKAYRQLKMLIEDESYWKEDDKGKILPDGPIQNITPSFLEVIRKEDDENIISNLLAYFFEYSNSAFQRFAEDVLGIKDMAIPFDIKRETEERIDICISSDTDIIVIENKIRSGINGVDKKSEGSQLKKYYSSISAKAKKEAKKPHFFIFAPDYSKIDLTKYENGEAYSIIRYSEIYRFFISETETFISDRIFPDFLRGLKRHTLSFPELQFETMKSRLLRRISLFRQK